MRFTPSRRMSPSLSRAHGMWQRILWARALQTQQRCCSARPCCCDMSRCTHLLTGAVRRKSALRLPDALQQCIGHSSTSTSDHNVNRCNMMYAQCAECVHCLCRLEDAVMGVIAAGDPSIVTPDIGAQTSHVPCCEANQQPIASRNPASIAYCINSSCLLQAGLEPPNRTRTLSSRHSNHETGCVVLLAVEWGSRVGQGDRLFVSAKAHLIPVCWMGQL